MKYVSFLQKKLPKRSSLDIIRVVLKNKKNHFYLCLSSQEISEKSNEKILWNVCIFVFLDPKMSHFEQNMNLT